MMGPVEEESLPRSELVLLPSNSPSAVVAPGEPPAVQGSPRTGGDRNRAKEKVPREVKTTFILVMNQHKPLARRCLREGGAPAPALSPEEEAVLEDAWKAVKADMDSKGIVKKARFWRKMWEDLSGRASAKHYVRLRMAARPPGLESPIQMPITVQLTDEDKRILEVLDLHPPGYPGSDNVTPPAAERDAVPVHNEEVQVIAPLRMPLSGPPAESPADSDEVWRRQRLLLWKGKTEIAKRT